MKFLLFMFVFLCIHNTQPIKTEKKEEPKKEANDAFNLAPFILIVNN